MILLTIKRSDFLKVDRILPYVSFTGDSERVYFNITDMQYKHFKDRFPDHIKFKLPK